MTSVAPIFFCAYAHVYYKITNFLNCAIGKVKKMQKKCILQSTLYKMKKICIFICVYQKFFVPLHRISKLIEI